LSPNNTRHPYKRPLATLSMVLVTFLTIWLTNEATVQHLAEIGGGSASAGLPKVPTVAASQIHFTDTSMPGYKVFENQCATCHGTHGEGKVGPPIYGIGKFWNAKQLKTFVDNPAGGMPPKGGLTSDTQVEQVVQWLVKQKNSGK
jgi:menaquinol-cytochrome c reductase cytochrome b/c subunit